MRFSTIPLTGIAILLSTLIMQSATAQKIDLHRDTISRSAAIGAHTKYRNDMSASGRKLTSSVTFDVEQLGEILDKCRSRGVSQVKMVIVTLQKQDTAHYARHHAGLTTAQRNDLIGRQTILIRVPRSAFGISQSSSGVQKENPLMLSLLSAGLLYLEKPYGHITGDEDMYFEIGFICPPPSTCD